MTPSIESAWLCGDCNDVKLQDLSALSLVPFQFVPHVDSDIKDAETLLDTLSDRYWAVKRSWVAREPIGEFCLCPDDAGIVLIGDKRIEFGETLTYRSNL